MPQKATMLSVDDDAGLQTVVTHYLEGEGYQTLSAESGQQLMDILQDSTPNIILLDLVLPDMDGISILSQLRGMKKIPVIVVSGKSDTTEKIVCLEMGADDYMTKPFEMRELSARVHALLRRAERAAAPVLPEADRPPTIRLGDLEINQAERRVLRGGVEAHLTPTEFDLLVHLARRPRTVLPRERLLADVWGWADASGTRTVDSHIKGLRRKLGANLIRTVHGVGYALEVPT